MKRTEQTQTENGRVIPQSDAARARRAWGVILPLCLLGVLLALAVVAVANDTYAFVKPKTTYVLQVTEPQSVKETAMRFTASFLRRT